MSSLTVDQFCMKHGISRAFFYKLAAQGQAPRTFKVGRCTRISEEASIEWVREREAKSANTQVAA
jgi:predicted DNA-binding transcriptional regulator AlpA